MKKPATKSAIADAAKGLDIAATCLMDIIGPELKAEFEQSDNERKRIGKWFDDGMKANAHQEKAIKILLESLRSTANHKDMTPEVKETVDTMIIVIEDRQPFKYDFEAIFSPLIKIVGEDAKSEVGRNAGSAPKKPEGKSAVKKLWEDWCEDSLLFKNKTEFIKYLVSNKNKEKYCASPTTANEWFEEIRRNYPNATLEEKLPKRK